MTESPEQRSRIMRAVKSRDTGPELIVRRLVHGMGFRYRLHRRDLPDGAGVQVDSAGEAMLARVEAHGLLLSGCCYSACIGRCAQGGDLYEYQCLQPTLRLSRRLLLVLKDFQEDKGKRRAKRCAAEATVRRSAD